MRYYPYTFNNITCKSFATVEISNYVYSKIGQKIS